MPSQAILDLSKQLRGFTLKTSNIICSVECRKIYRLNLKRTQTSLNQRKHLNIQVNQKYKIVLNSVIAKQIPWVQSMIERAISDIRTAFDLYIDFENKII